MENHLFSAFCVFQLDNYICLFEESMSFLINSLEIIAAGLNISNMRNIINITCFII